MTAAAYPVHHHIKLGELSFVPRNRGINSFRRRRVLPAEQIKRGVDAFGGRRQHTARGIGIARNQRRHPAAVTAGRESPQFVLK